VRGAVALSACGVSHEPGSSGLPTSAGTVTFKGFGTSFEANFVWEVRNESGAVVAKGFTMGGSGDGTFGELTFTARLTPGK
jgi:hypothetical protein